MPYIHKNGCTCMTMTEFLAGEGKREGKTGAEVWDDIVQDLNDDSKESEQRYLDNPEWLLEEFKKECELTADCYEEGKFPIPVEIIKVESAKVSQNLRSSSSLVVLIAKCKDGKVRRAKWSSSHWSGTFYDPPEEDADIEWENA